MLNLYIIQSILAKLDAGFKPVLNKTIPTFIFWLYLFSVVQKKSFWNFTAINQYTAWGNVPSAAEWLPWPCPHAAPTAQVLEGVRVPGGQMLVDPTLVLGLPGQSPEPRVGLQAVDKMQGEILQSDIRLLSLTTSAEWVSHLLQK